MNADEIVMALRICNNPKGHRCSKCPIFSRYEHRTCKATVDKAAADLIESLQAQIAASQRRADAAVEDLSPKCCICKHIKDKSSNSGQCGQCDIEYSGFEWRGPQSGEEIK